ncbi:MAG: hypothetical protein DI547_17145 [Sphingobium sp.]|nr:MAG: hypothetical protein DI547_17145 [Sphingobium sp.]
MFTIGEIRDYHEAVDEYRRLLILHRPPHNELTKKVIKRQAERVDELTKKIGEKLLELDTRPAVM